MTPGPPDNRPGGGRRANGEPSGLVAAEHSGWTLQSKLFLLQAGEGIANLPAENAFTVIPFRLVKIRIERYVVAGLTAGSSK